MRIKRKFIPASVLFLVISIIAGVFSYRYIKAKGSDDCLVCHEDKELTMDVSGKKVSIYINPGDYKKSGHNSVECTDCH